MRQAQINLSTWTNAFRYGHISDIFLTLCSLLNILNLCAVIADRCCNLCSPFKYQQQVTKSKVVVVVITIWVRCLVFALSSFIFYYPLYKHESEEMTLCELILRVPLIVAITTSNRKYNHVFSFNFSNYNCNHISIIDYNTQSDI